jgi:Uma2 family endonuclease
MGQEKFKDVAIEDYLAIEQEDRVRYEYHDGQLVRMAGGSVTHSDICNNVATALTNLTRASSSGCRAFNSEMKIEVAPGGKYIYPDAGASCGKRKESDRLKGAITNPVLVVEVLSPNSIKYDTGAKLRFYFSIPSITEYLIVYQDRAEVMLYRRHGNGDLFGLHSAEGIKSSIELNSISSALKLADIYYGVDFADAEQV